MKVRDAVIQDAASIVRLVQQMALHDQKSLQDVHVTEATLVEHCFGEHAYCSVSVAQEDDILVGYALYFFTYASSLASPVLYLEDLFVLKDYRKQGIGMALIKYLATIAHQHDCCRMEWHVFNWNKDAIAFYKKLGGILKDDLIQVRLDQKAYRGL